MTPSWRAFPFLLLTLLAATRASAQIDPEKRRLIQFGHDKAFSGPEPPASYIFYYINQPHFVRKDLTLRLAIAPVYLDSELGVSGDPEKGDGVTFGLAGGGWADSYYEVRQGSYHREESFTGDGGTISMSYFKNLTPQLKIPVNVVARAAAHIMFYERRSETLAGFELPDDHGEYSARLGLRIGGVPPELIPKQEAELSFWYAPYVRDHAGTYGIDGDRRLNRTTELYWTRLRFAYTLQSRSRFDVSAEGGGTRDADRFSAFRLGGMLPFASEFPLGLPGYYNGELSAREYALFTGRWSQGLDEAKLFRWSVFAAAADVLYLPGFEQPGPWNSGVGTGITFHSPNEIFLVRVDFGHGFNAIRSGGRGANSAALLMQFDLEAFKSKTKPRKAIRPEPTKPEGLDLGGLLGP